MKPLLIPRHWQSDEEYVAVQDKESSWSHKSPWGEFSAYKFVCFGQEIDLCHDDVVADFGGNDGFASYSFYMAHKVKPIVVDCEPRRIEHASKVYGLPTLQRFLEHMPELADKSVHWGFCSHTMEHMREPEKAAREIARVVKYLCLFIVPLESRHHAVHYNDAHVISFKRTSAWKKFLEANGWEIVKHGTPSVDEGHLWGRPA